MRAPSIFWQIKGQMWSRRIFYKFIMHATCSLIKYAIRIENALDYETRPCFASPYILSSISCPVFPITKLASTFAFASLRNSKLL